MGTSKNNNQERTYVFHKSKEFGKTERYEKTESELTKEEKDLLLGELISKWENNTKVNQLRFLKMIIENKSSIYQRTGNYAKWVLASVIHFFKVRWTAKRFNIWTGKLDKTYKEGYWLSYDNKIYYGHPMGLFFLSALNS